MLEVIDLAFDYHVEPLLHGVCFALPAGSLLHLRGNNGSGKTTLLKLLAGLLHLAEGEIRYNGECVSRNIAAYQTQICYVGHKSGISQSLTVLENCEFDLQRGQQVNGFDDLLKRFSLFELKNTPCALLSAGQRRRVGLLRLMISKATLWLLDEPLVALDQHAIDLLMVCLTEHLQRGGQVVVTSHQRLPLPIGDYQEYCL